MARDLTTVLQDSVYTAINGYDGSTDRLMFNNFPDHTTLTRNSDNWIHDLVGSTGIPPLNSAAASGKVTGTVFGGVLVTPRHMVLARHYVLPVNSVVYFYDRNNVKHSRVVTNNQYTGLSFGVSDYYVALLDSDLPSEIEPLKVLPPDVYKYFPDSQFNTSIPKRVQFTTTGDVPVIHTDQEEKSLISRLYAIDFGTDGVQGFDPNPNYYTSDNR